jgi:pimeloyl-ACP methyl ester carboxylesterase
MSTVPANAGQTVGIAARHITRPRGGATQGPVLFTSPGATSAVAMLDVDYKTYSLPAALAEDGFDVYVMDHTGVGRSPHQTMDKPCNADPGQQHFLIPNPLREPCRASYPHNLVTIFSEVTEVESVVEYIRKQTGRNKMSLAGWSRGMSRLGLYAAQHPDKVERLAIVGPGYRPDAPSDFPRSTVSHSFVLRTVGEPFANWERQRRCEEIVEQGIYDAISKSFRANADLMLPRGTPPADLQSSYRESGEHGTERRQDAS